MSLIIEVKVNPSSGKLAASLDKTGVIKIYLKSAPENGKANKELIAFLAKTLGIPQANLLIVSGMTSRKKKIKIDFPLTYDDVLSKLGCAVQKTFIGK